MLDNIDYTLPEYYSAIDAETKQSGFTMASDILTCSLLRTLAASTPGGRFLELGTGTGLSTSWILDGMTEKSTLISVDNDSNFLNIAAKYLKQDKRLSLVCADGGEWISQNITQKFDYIFADTWHGKYLMLEEALQMLNSGALYIIDDMLPQPNWPEGHSEKATALINHLSKRNDLFITKLNWATGIIICTKR